MSNIDSGTRILNIEDRDANWVKILTDPYLPTTDLVSGYTKGLLSSIQEFYNLYAINPANIREGFDFAGTIGNIYQVKVSANDLQGYLGDKITVSNGLTLVVNGTSNEVIDFALDIQETTVVGGKSLLNNSYTLKQLTEGTGINITSTADELSVAIDEAYLEGITYGIKYSWADETEMNAEIDMGEDDLGVREDLGQVWKYTTSWDFFFSLGTSTTEKTDVTNPITESTTGIATKQNVVNEETVENFSNVYNLILGNSPAYGDLIGDPLPLVIPTSDAVIAWSTVNQSTNTDTWQFNETVEEILFKKAGNYTVESNITCSNTSNFDRYFVFTLRNKNTSSIFYTRRILISGKGSSSISSKTFTIELDDTTVEILVHGETFDGTPSTALTLTSWISNLRLNFVSAPTVDAYTKIESDALNQKVPIPVYYQTYVPKNCPLKVVSGGNSTRPFVTQAVAGEFACIVSDAEYQPGTEGEALRMGCNKSIDTTGSTIGDNVYVAETGSILPYTFTKTSPIYQVIGTVANVGGSDGSIAVDIHQMLDDTYTKIEISDTFIKAVGETRDISTTGTVIADTINTDTINTDIINADIINGTGNGQSILNYDSNGFRIKSNGDFYDFFVSSSIILKTLTAGFVINETSGVAINRILKLGNLESELAVGENGMLYYNTLLNQVRLWSDGVWTSLLKANGTTDITTTGKIESTSLRNTGTYDTTGTTGVGIESSVEGGVLGRIMAFNRSTNIRADLRLDGLNLRFMTGAGAENGSLSSGGDLTIAGSGTFGGGVTGYRAVGKSYSFIANAQTGTSPNYFYAVNGVNKWVTFCDSLDSDKFKLYNSITGKTVMTVDQDDSVTFTGQVSHASAGTDGTKSALLSDVTSTVGNYQPLHNNLTQLSSSNITVAQATANSAYFLNSLSGDNIIRWGYNQGSTLLGVANVNGTSKAGLRLSESTVEIGLPLTVSGSGTFGSFGDGNVLLKLNAERAWTFEQDGTGGLTQLHLVPLDNSKTFKIIGDPLNSSTSYVGFVDGNINATGNITASGQVTHASATLSTHSALLSDVTSAVSGYLPLTGGTITGGLKANVGVSTDGGANYLKHKILRGTHVSADLVLTHGLDVTKVIGWTLYLSGTMFQESMGYHNISSTTILFGNDNGIGLGECIFDITYTA